MSAVLVLTKQPDPVSTVGCFSSGSGCAATLLPVPLPIASTALPASDHARWESDGALISSPTPSSCVPLSGASMRDRFSLRPPRATSLPKPLLSAGIGHTRTFLSRTDPEARNVGTEPSVGSQSVPQSPSEPQRRHRSATETPRGEGGGGDGTRDPFPYIPPASQIFPTKSPDFPQQTPTFPAKRPVQIHAGHV